MLRYPGLPRKLRRIDLDAARLPVLPARIQAGPLQLSLYSMLTTFGTPLDVTTDELRVESFFPADAQTEALLRRLGAPPAHTQAAPPP